MTDIVHIAAFLNARNGITGALTLQDFAINLLLALPAAWLLRRLGRDRLRFHCALATLTFATAFTVAAGLPVFSAGGFIVAGWLLMLRPIGIEAENGIEPGAQGCEAVGTTCLRIISGMGTPLLWWAAVAAIVAEPTTRSPS